MKRSLIAAIAAGIAVSALVAISACSSTSTTSFSSQLSIACGAAKGEIAILKGDGVFTGGAADTLTKVDNAITKVCSAGTSTTKVDLESIVNTTLPAVKSAVDSSSLSADKIKAADTAIDTAILAFNIAISLVQSTTTTAASDASATSSATAASSTAAQ